MCYQLQAIETYHLMELCTLNSFAYWTQWYRFFGDILGTGGKNSNFSFVTISFNTHCFDDFCWPNAAFRLLSTVMYTKTGGVLIQKPYKEGRCAPEDVSPTLRVNVILCFGTLMWQLHSTRGIGSYAEVHMYLQYGGRGCTGTGGEDIVWQWYNACAKSPYI